MQLCDSPPLLFTYTLLLIALPSLIIFKKVFGTTQPVLREKLVETCRWREVSSKHLRLTISKNRSWGVVAYLVSAYRLFFLSLVWNILPCRTTLWDHQIIWPSNHRSLLDLCYEINNCNKLSHFSEFNTTLSAFFNQTKNYADFLSIQILEVNIQFN